jgi:SAM-dependent methyltransferase
MSNGEEKFLNIRKDDWAYKTTHFHPEIDKETGLGIDIGCGLISVFEFCDNPNISITAIDPLLSQYNDIYTYKSAKCQYLELDSEDMSGLDSDRFNFAFCVNVIDHTPDPIRMMNEIHRILKKRGRLYFEVNFDDELSPAHYGLWNLPKVTSVIDATKWLLENAILERNPNYPQSLYHAILTKI